MFARLRGSSLIRPNPNGWRRSIARSIGFALPALAMCLMLVGCRDHKADELGLPDGPTPEPAPEMVSPPTDADPAVVVGHFFAGATALQVGDTEQARLRLEAAVEAAPGEAASWANLAIARLRGDSPDREGAAAAIAEARRLAPEDAGVAVVDAAVLAQLGRLDESRDALRRAVSAAPDNLRARFALYGVLDAAGEDEAANAELAALRERVPDNLAVAAASLRRAAAAEDEQGIDDALAVIDGRGSAIPDDAREQLTVAREALEGGAVGSAGRAAVGLANILLSSDVFRDDQAALTTDFQNVAEPIEIPLTLAVPPAEASAADWSLTFAATAAPDVDVDAEPSEGLLALATGAEALVQPFGLRGDGLRGAVAADIDNDGRVERIEVGAMGLRIVAMADDGVETVTAGADVLPESIRGIGFDGVWPVDLDLEGDLDLVISRADGSETIALRNDGDGRWLPFDTNPLAGMAGPRSMVWFDADGDGDGDLMAIDADGSLRRFINERTGVYVEAQADETAVVGDAGWQALAVADVGLAGRLSLLALRGDGAVIVFPPEGGSSELLRWVGEAPGQEAVPASMLWADLDNNGAGDLVIGWGDASQVWLAEKDGALSPLETGIVGRVDDAADLDGDGRLDLLGVGVVGDAEASVDSPAGAMVWSNQGGEQDYGWQMLRFQAKTTGDVRNNSFGIGGEVALRSSVLVQERAVERPWVHFGLGDASSDVYRVRWPNGAIQGEFGLDQDALVSVEQRLVGSCPWLFAWDGREMGFVTDILWRSPLGLRINAQTTAGVLMTRDRVKVAGEQLVAREGVYDLRVTAELWETHFFDLVGLTVVDHPADVEVWIDERFNVPPPPLEVQATGPLRPVVQALGAQGDDVSELLSARDGRTVADFGLGRYQGISGDHGLEIVLDESAGSDAGEVLVAQGWVYPTDSSINVAISQGEHVPPLPLSLEVPDAQAEGGWRVAREGLGFPAGKHKTMLIDLEGLWPEGQERRLRLRTTMEIYWDAMAVAERRPDAELRVTELRPDVADLRYRGFSATSHWPVRYSDERGARTSPEIPDYGQLAAKDPMWLDLAGRYTRFGDVGELLEAVDDRYVILNAGDEMAFRFAEPGPPPEGWERDFVFESDGWVKDGNFNTAYSATVLPLPSHDRPEYADQIVSGPVGTLEEDPMYKAHEADWLRYHTREVRTVHFAELLRLRTTDEAAGNN